MDDLILEAEQAATTGKQEIDTGTVLYVEFYTGKVKKHGQTTKTGRVYWQFAIYKNGKRERRVSPKTYLPGEFGYDGATAIEHCPYTGRVTHYWKKQKRGAIGVDGGDSGFRGSEETSAAIVDRVKGWEDLYVR